MEIFIRPLKIKDAFISYNWRNNPKVWELTGSKPDVEVTPEIELEWIDNALKKTNQKRFAICITKTDEYIGNVQLTDITDFNAEFHIFIGNPKFWNKGIGTKATKALIDYGFEHLKFNQIYLYVNEKNSNAIRAYEKCGFRKEKKIGNQFFMVINKQDYL